MTPTSRDDFLGNVRRALGRSSPSAVPEYAPLKIRRNDQRQKVVTIEARIQARRAELLDRLVARVGHEDRVPVDEGDDGHGRGVRIRPYNRDPALTRLRPWP